MPAERAKRSSRQLLVLALLALVVSTVWALRTSPDANADRYDYAGRAWHVLRGGNADPLIAYPLRFAFPGADRMPPENMTRPPLWPLLLVPWLKSGADDDAGVWMSAVFALALMLLLYDVSERGFGPGAGGLAALVWMASFTTVRGLWGGGPEIALALVLYALWTWSPGGHGRAGYIVCGALYGLLPWLHPLGWPLALLGFFARSHRYSPTGRIWLGVVALAVGLPWYVGLWLRLDTAVPLQGYAELAKVLHAPYDLAPYRELDPRPTLAVLADDPVLLARKTLRHGWEQLRHLDGWLSPLGLILAVWGARRDPRLALRDGLMLAAGFLVVAALGPGLRLLLPLSAVAATWAGAGYAEVVTRWPRAAGVLPVTVILALPWVLPVSSALRPGEEFADQDPALRDPPRAVIERIGEAGRPGSPIFTDSAVHAWRARRPAVLLPLSPDVLEALRARPPLRDANLVLLAQGRQSVWTSSAQAQWDSLFAGAESLPSGSPQLVLLRVAP